MVWESYSHSIVQSSIPRFFSMRVFFSLTCAGRDFVTEDLSFMLGRFKTLTDVHVYSNSIERFS